MLKETETEERIIFFVTFLSLVAFQLGGRAPLAPLTTPMIVANIFDWGEGGQTTNHSQRRREKFSKEELFMGQRYRRPEDQKLWPVSGSKPGFSKRNGLY